MVDSWNYLNEDPQGYAIDKILIPRLEEQGKRIIYFDPTSYQAHEASEAGRVYGEKFWGTMLNGTN